MKIEKDDPRLTAYVLGELSSDEVKRFDHAIAKNASLKLVVREIERTQVKLLNSLGTAEDKLLPRHRSAIMRAAREASGSEKVVELRSHKKAFKVWTWPLAAAAVVMASMFIVTLIPAPDHGESGQEVANGSSDTRMEEFVALENRGQNRKSIGLPLVAGNKSLSQITNSIRETRSLPSKQEVRIEEMLNAFPLEAKASVALWKGNSLGVEAMKCPWSPSGTLIFVKIRGAKDRSSAIAVEYQIDETSVISSNLLGYEMEENDRVRMPIPHQLSAGTDTLLAILIESRNDRLGKLTWVVDGEAGPEIELIRDMDREISPDSRFGALICGFGLWLRGEKPEMIDDSLILGIAREVAAESLVPDRYDFLELVDQAVKAKNR